MTARKGRQQQGEPGSPA